MPVLSVRVLRPVALVLVGLVLTVAFAFRASEAEGVYWGQAKVVFLAPENPVDQNSLAYTTSGVIATAGLVAVEVYRAERPRLSGTSVALYSMGHDTDLDVTQPNSGGQWAVNFSDAFLVVQVVGPTPERAQASLDETIGDIRAKLAELQPRESTPASTRIRTTLTPSTPSIHYVRGSPARAMVSALLLGSLLTFALVLVTERLARRGLPSTDRRTAAGSGPPGQGQG